MNTQLYNLRYVIVGILTLFMLLVCTDGAFAKRRSRSRSNAAAVKARREQAIKAAQSQYATAQQVLAAAHSVLAEMTSAASELRQARSESQELMKDLAEIEEDILLEQASDTPYVQLLEEISETKQKIAEIAKRVTEAAEFVRQGEMIRATEGSAAAFRWRQSVLTLNPALSALKMNLSSLVDKQAKLKRELFQQDSEWRNAHDTLLQSQSEERKAKSEVYANAPNRAAPKHEIKDAQQAAAAAQSAMAQAEQFLRSLGSTPTAVKTSKTSK